MYCVRGYTWGGQLTCAISFRSFTEARDWWYRNRHNYSAPLGWEFRYLSEPHWK